MTKTYLVNDKEMSLKQARNNYNISYKNVIEVSENHGRLWVTYKNGNTSIFKNVHGNWGFPVRFV